MSATFRLKGTAGPLLNQTFPLQGEMRLGGPGSDIVVADHASLSARLVVRPDAGEEACWLRIEQGEGIELNGQQLLAGAEVHLQSGDELRLGGARLLLQAPGRRPRRVLREPVLSSKPSKPLGAPTQPGTYRPRTAFVAALLGAALALCAYQAGRQLGWW